MTVSSASTPECLPTIALPVFRWGGGFVHSQGATTMAKKHYPTGLDNRMRDHDGEMRKKRSDTKVETLRQTYGPEFAKGYRGDALLDNVLK